MHKMCLNKITEKSYLLLDTEARFCRMSEEITCFMASKRNVVMKLEDENQGDSYFQCDVAEHFSLNA